MLRSSLLTLEARSATSGYLLFSGLLGLVGFYLFYPHGPVGRRPPDSPSLAAFCFHISRQSATIYFFRFARRQESFPRVLFVLVVARRWLLQASIIVLFILPPPPLMPPDTHAAAS